jgi:hypothetical protein
VNKSLSGTALTDAAQQQGFDPAFIALTNFPSVIEMMAENIDDYAAIGAAVSSNQEDDSAVAFAGLRFGIVAQYAAAAG